MMTRKLKALDVVALLQDRPEEGLVRGQVGTIVEQLGSHTFEVEFSDEEGRTYAQTAIPYDQLMFLRYKPGEAA